MNIAYCEYSGCRVVIFTIAVGADSTELTNCPGCGRYGRLKDVVVPE